MGEHSKWSASNYEADSACPGRRVFTGRAHIDLDEIRRRTGVRVPPNSSSVYADEGTAAHQMLEWCLSEGFSDDPYDHVGKMVKVSSEDDPETRYVKLTEDMAENIQAVIERIFEVSKTETSIIYAEQRVYYNTFLGIATPDHAWGTADCIAVLPDEEELHTHDLKYGRGKEVEVEDNAQLKLYALGAYDMVKDVFEIKRIRVFIQQPRIGTPVKEAVYDVESLLAWAAEQADGSVIEQLDAEMAFDKHVDNRGSFAGWAENYLRAGGHCNSSFCQARAVCPKVAELAVQELSAFTPAGVDEFDAVVDSELLDQDESDEARLAAALRASDFIEGWIKEVRAEADRRLQNGLPVPGFKLVQGKRGNRQWRDEEEAEELITKKFRIKQDLAYTRKIISPTQAEKLAKAGDIGPRQWPVLQELITQSEGKPHVAPAEDPRPAIDIRPVEEEFEDVSEDMSEEDLF